MKKTSTSLIKTIFGLDNAFVRTCALIYDLMLVNVLFVLTSLPVLTIGMSKYSLYQTLTERRKSSEISVIGTYLAYFKSKKGFTLGLVEVLLTAVCLFDMLILLGQTSFLAQLVKMLSLSVLFLMTMTFLMAYPLETKAELAFKDLLRQAFLLAGVHLPVTLLALAVLLGVFFLLLFSGLTLLIGLSLLALGGYAGLVYGHLYLLEKRTK